MRRVLRTLFVSFGLLLAILTQAAIACDGRPTVWDLPLGTDASELPDAFGEYACGTDGGPPSRLLSGFADYHLCDVSEQELYEVYFRYTDEQEFIARALEQERRIAMCEGTRVFGIPVIASGLIDESGILRGLRLVTDARGIEPAERDDHWALGATLRRLFEGDWICNPTPMAPGSTPAASFVPNQECSMTVGDMEFLVREAYFHRAGQSFKDEFNVVHPGYFVSEMYFQMFQNTVP